MNVKSGATGKNEKKIERKRERIREVYWRLNVAGL